MHARSLWLLLPACAVLIGHAAETQAPEAKRLAERIAAVHAAMGEKNVEGWYAMLPPSLRARMSLEDFKKDIRWETHGSQQPAAPMQAEVNRVCSCVASWSRTRCVVSVRLLIEDPQKGKIVDMPLESWDYERGDWYLGYIGVSTEGRCPGEPRQKP